MSEQGKVPPALLLRQLAFVMRASRALYAGAQLGVADILAAGPMTSGEIAAKAGTVTPTMRRLLRALVAHGVFEEEAPDRFRLNPAAELLRKDVPASQRAAFYSPPVICDGGSGRISSKASAADRRSRSGRLGKAFLNDMRTIRKNPRCSIRR
jgi:hypothetical protein